MQTIIGSGGAVAIELAKALAQYTKHIRLVSRNPRKVNDTDELHAADVLDYKQLDEAVKGSSIIYITVGFTYSLKVWQESWPKFMANAIKVCKKHKCKMVFFDNIYMYEGSNLNPIKEDLIINPPSKKGRIRAQIAQMILDEVKAGNLTALIARCADYYGPSIKQNSMLTEMVVKPLSQGKRANWMCSTKFKHSFTYTKDAGEATALLGNTEDAYDEVWHLPTAKDPLTGGEWIAAFAKELGAEPKIQVAPKFLVKIMGLFVPIMKELHEMLYQYDKDYVFDSSKFNSRFKFKTTTYEEGIQEIVKIDYPNL